MVQVPPSLMVVVSGPMVVVPSVATTETVAPASPVPETMAALLFA